MVMNTLFHNKLFVIGLLCRLIGCVIFQPTAQTDWFIPFFTHFLENPGVDPWSSSVSIHSLRHFPYGPIMFTFIMVFILIGKCIDLFFSIHIATFGLRTAILFSDITLLVIIDKLFPNKSTEFLKWYWLSPIVFAANYWTGQLDIIPITILTASFLFLQRNAFLWSGIMLGAALSTKMSMAIVVPFFFLYFIKNKRLRDSWVSFCIGFCITVVMFFAMPLLSLGYREMVFGTPELERLLELHFTLGTMPIYLTPILYGGILYASWRISRMAFDLFYAMTGCSFLILMLTTITPPGWYLWFIPFLSRHLAESSLFSSQRWLGLLFSFMALGCQILFWPAPTLTVGPDPLFLQHLMAIPFIKTCMPFWYTATMFFGILVIMGILRNGVLRNDLFIIGKRPVTISISGDSGSGKDTCARSIVELLGENSVVHVSGDDYHLWDRYAPMWKKFTHLSPRANDFRRFYTNIIAILERKPILCQTYDHTIGRFLPPSYQKSSDFVLITGLHALYNNYLNTLFDLRIFLDMHEDLRVFLKCKRDVLERKATVANVLSSIERRKTDSLTYIMPQKNHADLIFSLEPLSTISLETFSNMPHLQLRITVRHALYYETLVRNLIILSKVHVDVDPGTTPSEHIITIEGHCSKEDIAEIAYRMIPNLEDILALQPHWSDGLTGIIQLTILCHLMQNCKERA